MGEEADAHPREPVSQLLADWANHDPAARDRLMPIVYEELRRLAHHYMRSERGGHTLQTTALVHEVYLRVCLPDLYACVAHRLSFDVRDAAAQLHDLAGSSLTMSAHERQVRVPVARLYTGIKRAGDQVGRLSQNGDLVIRNQCWDTRDCESACRK